MDPSLQLFLSITTLVLTPIFSAIVVAYQLSRTQGYWKEQQVFLREKEEFRLRLGVLKSATSLLNQMNQMITEFHIYRSSRDIALAIHKLTVNTNASLSAYYQKEYESFREKAASAYLQFRRLSFDLSELSAEIAIYFDERRGAQIIHFREASKNAADGGPTKHQIHQWVEQELLSHEPEVTIGRVGQQYDTLTEPLKPTNQARDILAELHSEVLQNRQTLLK